LRERLGVLEQNVTGALPALVVAALGNLSDAQVLELLKVGSASSPDWVAGSGGKWCWLGDVRLCRLDQASLKRQLGTFSVQHAPPSLVRQPHCCPLVAHPPPPPIDSAAASDCSSTNVSPEAKDALAGWLRERLGVLEQNATDYGLNPAVESGGSRTRRTPTWEEVHFLSFSLSFFLSFFFSFFLSFFLFLFIYHRGR
jgi:hypothetical protein